MVPKDDAVLWHAEPHTVAKIAILENYLNAWFQIFGRRSSGQDLLYVDGFAGPGRYTNASKGSPVAALRAAREVRANAGSNWTAGHIRCAFIESNADTYAYLEHHLQPFMNDSRLAVLLFNTTFVDGMARLRARMPLAFQGSQPLFVFIDPFGATGVPFSVVRDILASSRSEVLINLNADAIGRIFRAGEAANHELLLTTAFGDGSWHDALAGTLSARERSHAIVQLYMEHLRAVPNVRYVYSFEMLTAKTQVGKVGYFLVFASRHPRGLEKMKGAMKRMDQTGSYQFSNTRVGQAPLFRFNRPEDYAPSLHKQFVGQGPVRFGPDSTIHDFALLETPFENPKKMLEVLDKQGLLHVTSTNPK